MTTAPTPAERPTRIAVGVGLAAAAVTLAAWLRLDARPALGLAELPPVTAIGTLFGLATWILASQRRLRRTLAEVDRRTVAAFTVVGVAHLAFVTAVVPHGVWHTNGHDFEKLPALFGHDLLAHGSLDVHGATPIVIYRLVDLALPWVTTPFHVTSVIATLSVLLMALLVRLETGRTDAGIAAAVLLATVPARLRLAGTLEFLLTAGHFTLLALVLAEVWLRDRRTSTLGAAVAAATLAMTSHLEMMGVVPMVLGLHLALRAPGIGRAIPWRAGLPLFLLVPHLLSILGASDRGALPTSQGGGLSGILGSIPLEGWIVAVVAVAGLVGLVRWGRRVGAPARWTPWTSAGAWLLFVTVPVVAALRHPAWDGLSRTSVPCTIRKISVVFQPESTPPIQALLLGAGLLATARTDRRTLVRLTVPVLVLTVLYVANADSLSASVRLTAGDQYLLAGLGARGLVAVADHLAVRGAVPVLLAVVVGTVAPYVPWLRFAYPQQVEQAPLFEAWARARAGAHVATLGVADVDELDRRRFQVVERAYPEVMLASAGPVVGLRALLADPAMVSAGDWYWYRGGPCYRVHADTEESRVRAVYVAGRAVKVPEPLQPYTGDTCMLSTQPAFDVARIAPCWHHADEATCAASTPEGCAWWTLPATCDPPPPYEDPLCAAVAATFDLDPVIELTAPQVNESMSPVSLQHAAPVFGLYRLRRKR